ncbi:MAG TPA: prepilin-type N-terminal cleavage/methylation domain-containing protein [Pyrinomonadaceae bacterium]|nr:prepilin-type N-terminal cleavage/methylation domain-containing protein [Pyrinomonadaceae bacterium]
MQRPVKTRRNARGFSLIELMIVIAIIGILIGVGIPAWRSSVTRANETATIQNLRTIATEERNYYMGHSNYGTFDQLIEAGGLDKTFTGETPTRDGYTFTLKITAKSGNQPASFSVNADPQVAEGLSATGKRHFYIGSDTNGVTANETQPATPQDAPPGH